MPKQQTLQEHRDDLTGEHALTDIGQLVLLVLFAGAWVADSFFLHATTFLSGSIPLAIRVPIGAVLLALAAYLGASSHRTIFGTTRDEPHVVRTGVFSIVRHPMYLSEILLYLGWLACGVSLIAGRRLVARHRIPDLRRPNRGAAPPREVRGRLRAVHAGRRHVAPATPKALTSRGRLPLPFPASML